MADIGSFLLSLISPAEAEAKVNYKSPQLQKLSESVTSGQLADIDPTVLQVMQRVIKTAEGIPEETDMMLEAPSPDRRVLGQTYPDELTTIKIRPYEAANESKAANTMVHELMHFLQNIKSRSYDDTTALRQHAVIDALLSPDPDKASIVHSYMRENFPNESERSGWFKRYKAETMNLLQTLQKYIGQ